MTRKQFIESLGASCRNWRWSWSFVNHENTFVVFGAWDIYTAGGAALILDEDWQFSDKGRRQPAYPESREHLRLVEEEAYKLFSFQMIYSDEKVDEAGAGPASIGDFVPSIEQRSLLHIGRKWYAAENFGTSSFPDEVPSPSHYAEGATATVSVNKYERSARARADCISYRGCRCSVCGFDFGRVFGPLGQGFIHVHHVVPLSEIRKGYTVDPRADLVPICPNCHAMVHRTQPPLAVEQLRAHLQAVAESESQQAAS